MKSRMGCIQYTVAINEEIERERERGANCDLLQGEGAFFMSWGKGVHV